MKHWTLDDIAWDQYDPARVDPDILKVVKAAAMVERNAADYTAYLRNVFTDDAYFADMAEHWEAEEIQHGDALGRWAEMADPSFDYRDAFRRFREGYQIPIEVDASVRGSRTGELIARCIVETGTSSFYSALRDAADEPVLKDICHRIAGDEFRHYKMFYTHMRKYLDRENIPTWRRVMVAVSRIKESEDDELSYAYYCANFDPSEPYVRKTANLAYAARAFSYYRPPHVERASNMVLKAAGLKPQGRFGRFFGSMMWKYVSNRSRRLEEELRAA
jgi:rubrerythrin